MFFKFHVAINHITKVILQCKLCSYMLYLDTAVYYVQLYFTHLVSPPVIIKQPINEVVGVYSSVTFECNVQGYGYVNVEWRKLESALPKTAIVNNTVSTNGVSSILEITNVVGYYSGMYCCGAINLAGQTISVYGNLSVQGKSIIQYIYLA